MEENLEYLATESFLKFLDSDYGKDFLIGMKTAIEIIIKQTPTPTEERNHYGN